MTRTEEDLLGTRETAMAAIVFITVWKNFGYFMVIFLAGLQGISAELYEAASLDGASAWQKFRYITLPALRPTFNYVVIFGLIGSFQVFDQVFILTSGGPARAASTPRHSATASSVTHPHCRTCC